MLQRTVGTISYMAPEIAQKALDKHSQNTQTIFNPNQMDEQNILQIVESKEENEKYTSKVDIWSLGTLFHELITGNQLFAWYHVKDAKEALTEIIKFGSYYTKWKTAQEFKSTSDLRNNLEFYLPWKLVGLDKVAKLIDKML